VFFYDDPAILETCALGGFRRRRIILQKSLRKSLRNSLSETFATRSLRSCVVEVLVWNLVWDALMKRILHKDHV